MWGVYHFTLLVSRSSMHLRGQKARSQRRTHRTIRISGARQRRTRRGCLDYAFTVARAWRLLSQAMESNLLK